MLSPGTQTWNILMRSHGKNHVFTWNAPMWSAGTHEEHNISLEALMRASAACCLWLDQAHAGAQTRVSEPQTHMLRLGNRRVTLNEFRTPHSKLFGKKRRNKKEHASKTYSCQNRHKTAEKQGSPTATVVPSHPLDAFDNKVRAVELESFDKMTWGDSSFPTKRTKLGSTLFGDHAKLMAAFARPLPYKMFRPELIESAFFECMLCASDG